MSKRKTTDERINEKNEKIQQLMMEKKQLEARKKEEDRKARVHRLIQIGAEVESVLGAPVEEEDLPKLRKFLLDQDARGGYFSRAMGKEQRGIEGRTEQRQSPVPDPQNEPDSDDPLLPEGLGFITP